MRRLEGKVAVITGAASGMGRASAQRFAREGARVVVADIQVEAGQALAADLPDGLFVHTDVSQPEQVQALVETTQRHYGRLDIMFNNAGVSTDTVRLADSTIEQWRKVLSVNLEGVFYGMKYAIPAMLSGGGGVVLNTASVAGMVGVEYNSLYGTTKAGVVQLTKTAALEYAKQNIRVNALAPGATDTPMLHQGVQQPNPEEFLQLLAQPHPIPGLITPEQIAAAALFLVSDEAAFITGVILPIDGGYLAR